MSTISSLTSLGSFPSFSFGGGSQRRKHHRQIQQQQQQLIVKTNPDATLIETDDEDDNDEDMNDSQCSVEVHDMVLGSSTTAVTTPASHHTNRSETAMSANRALFSFDGINLDLLPRLLLTDLWSNNPEIVLRTLEVIGEMCRSVDDDMHNVSKEQMAKTNRNIVREVGGHLALILTMRRWMSNPSIQAEGCFVLGAAGMDHNFTNAAVDVGAIETILAAMKTYPSHEAVQLYGCGAILVLSLDDANTAKHFVMKLHGLEIIISSLTNFPSSTDIEDLACQIFLGLSEYMELKVALVKSGAIRALGSVFERYCSEQTIAAGRLCDSQSVEEMAKETIKRLLGL